ncbi:LLM class flavin-dependent oxidoreductase [Gynuella sp.]|uniref:LLM class flavin-dependent oxidoreductase n=1 Tax=Gynuella sp. TaxID=2969146 RepID=UPI003D11D5F5
MIPFSILDLAPVNDGESVSQSFANSRQLAINAEQNGYHRIWLAEHHGMSAVASAATSVVIGHIGASTQKIRIGAGGIMLPNHSPLVIAEQFGTLAALFPDRVDLGLGRAPGTDMATARALRRNLNASVDQYPEDIRELQRYLGERQADQQTVAVPGVGSKVPLWLLGSSLYSAQLAAQMGLPYSFASHFAPDHLLEAIQLYRHYFQPSVHLEKPYVMVGVMAVVADTDEEARYLMTSVQQQFVNLRRGANRAFPRPVDDMQSFWSPMEKAAVEHTLTYALVGSVDTVRMKLQSFMAETQADELIVSIPVHQLDARLKALELLAKTGLMKAA